MVRWVTVPLGLRRINSTCCWARRFRPPAASTAWFKVVLAATATVRRAPGSGTAKLLAFVAAILSVVFYAYAPFLSHDLLPGLLFLLFIFFAHRWLEQRHVADAVYLVLLGAAVTLIKQTYVIVWLSVMLYAMSIRI